MIVYLASSSSVDCTSGRAGEFFVSEQQGDFADERLARRYWPPGARAVHARDLAIDLATSARR